jgi:hypothetical protein
MTSQRDRVNTAIRRRDSITLRKIAQKTWKQEDRNVLAFLADLVERDQQNEEVARVALRKRKAAAA